MPMVKQPKWLFDTMTRLVKVYCRIIDLYTGRFPFTGISRLLLLLPLSCKNDVYPDKHNCIARIESMLAVLELSNSKNALRQFGRQERIELQMYDIMKF